jgi:lysophospholipase L1-like esterase
MNTNPRAKRILCFGDSYTWGYDPGSDVRIPADTRWTGVLQNELGFDFEVIEEGLSSRTLVSKDPRPGKEGRPGKNYLIPCLDSHTPLDLVILFLGTNELKDRFNMSAEDIAQILELEFVKPITTRVTLYNKVPPKLLIVSPPLLDINNTHTKDIFSGAAEKNQQLHQLYAEIAQRQGCYFFDAASLLTVGDDGIHLDVENNKKFGIAISDLIKQII